MGVPTAGDFNKWDGTKFTNTDWDQNVDKTVEILADGTYDLNVNQITASTYVGLPTEDEVYNINVENGYLYVSGAGNFETEQAATPGQSVLVDTTGGSTMKGNDGSTYVSEQASKTTVALPASNASNPRWDLVEFDASAGTFSVNQGTAAANPTYPSLGANKDAIAYVYRKASTAGNTVYNRDILDARVSIKNKTVDGHFKTNFSINQKEDTENSSMQTQQMFQRVPYETKFDYVQEDKTNLQYIETVVVPADSVNGEIEYAGGTWGTSDDAAYAYNRVRFSSTTTSGTATFSFTGVSCNIMLYETSNPCSTFIAELSSDGGSTYHSKQLINTNKISGGQSGSVYELYQGLEYGDYKVKITTIIVPSATYLTIEAFSYATYLNQKPMMQSALTSGGASDINDVPPQTTLFSSGWAYILQTGTAIWNYLYNGAEANGLTAEYKFYGNSIYINAYIASTYHGQFSVTIDGATTYVKNSTVSMPNYNAGKSVWVRLDNGSLPEGVHTVKITTTAASGSQRLIVQGWAHYASKNPTTCARSLICGKDSYAVHPEDSSFSYTGTWTNIEDASTMFQRLPYTTTNSDYVTITTPTNVKAIYVVIKYSSDRGEIKLSLGGASSNVRYINTDTSNYTTACAPCLAYDSYMDGISLDSQELRITKESGSYMAIEGVIFEIGDAVEVDAIHCMPKWGRNNISSFNQVTVTTSHRLDVYGSKSDASPGRQPMVHSGFVYHTSGSNIHYRHGLNMQDMNYKYERYGPTPKVYQLDAAANNNLYNLYGDYGLITTGDYATNEWIRISLFPNRVI